MSKTCYDPYGRCERCVHQSTPLSPEDYKMMLEYLKGKKKNTYKGS